MQHGCHTADDTLRHQRGPDRGTAGPSCALAFLDRARQSREQSPTALERARAGGGPLDDQQARRGWLLVEEREQREKARPNAPAPAAPLRLIRGQHGHGRARHRVLERCQQAVFAVAENLIERAP